jgi:hypothetical protein
MTLLAFAFWCLASPSQPERGQKPADQPALAPFRDLRFFIGSPSDGSRLPSPTPRGGAREPRNSGRACPTQRADHTPPGRPFPGDANAQPPLRPRMQRVGAASARPDTTRVLFPRSAATYNTTLTALRSTRCQMALLLAPLAERSSRRYARSPGEAGGGRSDLCHDNDEPDPVNRRARVGDNVVDPASKFLAGRQGLLELVGVRPSTGDEQPSADRKQRQTQLGDHRELAERPGRRHIE